MEQQSESGWLAELACLCIFVGLIWMFIPGTVIVKDGTLEVTPDFLPLLIFGIGVVGMILLSLMSWVRSN